MTMGVRYAKGTPSPCHRAAAPPCRAKGMEVMLLFSSLNSRPKNSLAPLEIFLDVLFLAQIQIWGKVPPPQHSQSLSR